MDAIKAWFVERLPQDEDISSERCTELAVELGRERRLWEHLVQHYEDRRHYVELYRDVHLDVWLICWQNQQDTGFHDHDLSSGAVFVADGELVEDRWLLGEGAMRKETTPRAAGTSFDFDGSRIHCMRHPGGVPAVSIHLYSPALWRMGYYSFDPAGNLCRTSITYADEMWEQPSGLDSALRA